MWSLEALERAAGVTLSRLPVSLRVLLENLLRHEDGRAITAEDVVALASWDPMKPPEREIAFYPARVLLQDFTGVPVVVDLAAMREAVARRGGDSTRVNPRLSVDLVIDHSVQVDRFGAADALRANANLELTRNRERFVFLRWAQQAFRNFRLVPPATGIVHQVNLEYLARVVSTDDRGEASAYPDTVVGTDSHTPMVNSLGVLGWGVGGIEAEAAMLGQPIPMLIPEVVGVRFTGALREGATATDLVLTVTQLLRGHGVVDKFVEFYGPGLASLSVADRATLANMAPEYGATVGFFPVDEATLDYLRLTGRDEAHVALVEAYAKAQGLFRTDGMMEPVFSSTVSLDLGSVEASLAGPRRPQDRVPLSEAKRAFRQALVATVEGGSEGFDPEAVSRWIEEGGAPVAGQGVRVDPGALGRLTQTVPVQLDGQRVELGHGSVVIAAITSCTNTSNPTVMLGAGILARKAVEHGLKAKPWVKTSLAPGSRVVTEYLAKSGLLPHLEALRFHLVGYGCTTCIGNSGPLPEPVARAVTEGNLVAVAVLSGNRNFEGRINPLVRANFLASPPLVVAYALAGRMDIDLIREPLGHDRDGPVFLRDIWPTQSEIAEVVRNVVSPDMFRQVYARLLEGDEAWRSLPVPVSELFEWEPASTYVRRPPFFEDLPVAPPALTDLKGLRVLAVLGDSVTTDHISPAGSIPADSPAGRYLIANAVTPRDFNSYGARRGNHEVMVRGTFGNIRLRNALVLGVEGGFTVHLPDGEQMTIFDAAMRYQEEGIPLIILAGREYGAGSSRDWAAKGTQLLGVRAVLAESYERIHRSNLVGMGVLPLQFQPGTSRTTLGLTGRERFDIQGLTSLTPGARLRVRAVAEDRRETAFEAIARIDTPVELDYCRHGGILPFVLRRLLEETA